MTIEARLQALERQNRKMRCLLGAVLMSVGAFVLLGMRSQMQPKDARYRIVYASKFALQDPRTGKVRAELSHQTLAGGWAGLTLWDEEGNPRAEFKLWEDGSTLLSMLAADRRNLASVRVSKAGETKLNFGR